MKCLLGEIFTSVSLPLYEWFTFLLHAIVVLNYYMYIAYVYVYWIVNRKKFYLILISECFVFYPCDGSSFTQWMP